MKGISEEIVLTDLLHWYNREIAVCLRHMLAYGTEYNAC
jgi:hypothetical protein